MRVKTIAVAWMVAAGPVAYLAAWSFPLPDEIQSKGQELVYCSLLTIWAWVAVGLMPASAALSASSGVSAAERDRWAERLGRAAIFLALTHLLSEMVRGPWYGVIGHTMKAALASGGWGLILHAIAKPRRARLATNPPAA